MKLLVSRSSFPFTRLRKRLGGDKICTRNCFLKCDCAPGLLYTKMNLQLQILCAFVVLGTGVVQGQQQARRLAQQYQPQNANNNNYTPEEEDYQQQQQQQQRQPLQQQARQEGSEGRLRSTTFIPIIRFDKEQGDAGSYKAS